MAKIRTDFVTNCYVLVIGKETNRCLAEKAQTMFPNYVLTGEDLLEKYADKVGYYRNIFGNKARLIEASDIDRDKLYFYLFDYDWLTDGVQYMCGKYRDADGNCLNSMRDDRQVNVGVASIARGQGSLRSRIPKWMLYFRKFWVLKLLNFGALEGIKSKGRFYQ